MGLGGCGTEVVEEKEGWDWSGGCIGCAMGGGEVKLLAGVETSEFIGTAGTAGAGDMDDRLARPGMFGVCEAETGFGAANCVFAETLVVVAGGDVIPEREVAAVVVDCAGVAEMKSSKSSSSPATEDRVADGGATMGAGSSSPNSNRSTSGSFFLGSSAFRLTEELAAAVVRLGLLGVSAISSPSSYSSNLSRRP